MKKNIEKRRSLKTLLRDECGATAIIATIYLPVILGFFTLATDMAYVLSIRNQLQVTAEAAALAATTQLPDKASTISYALNYANKNMATSRYGSIVVNSDIVLGAWATSNCSGQGCFIPEPHGGDDCTSFGCNAVKVTTRTSTANGNPLNLFFAPMIGLSQFNVSATAIAVYGSSTGSKIWNVIIVQDISMSFSEELANSKKADTALLDCVHGNAAVNSQIGITLFTGVTTQNPYQAQLSATGQTNYNTLAQKIQGIQECNNPGMPACSGSNMAAGMTSAIAQLCPNSTCTASTNNAMVVLTDGIPNCGSQGGCSNSGLQTNAVNAANTAATKGIDVFTVYYGDSNSDATWLAGLKRNNGIALKTPDATKLATLMGQICAQSLSHRLVW